MLTGSIIAVLNALRPSSTLTDKWEGMEVGLSMAIDALHSRHKVYISGDRDHPEEFSEMMNRLALNGYTPVNPWELNVQDSLNLLQECDAIIFLPNFEDDVLATAEAAVAKCIALKVIDAVTFNEHERPLLVEAGMGIVPKDVDTEESEFLFTTESGEDYACVF